MSLEPETEPRGFPEPGHDHQRCIATALAEASRVCAERGTRLTALRRRVLEILWQSHRPLGAYAVLEILSRDGRPAAPPTVYRALEFLLDQGLVHRIASLNAFVGCVRPGHPAAGQFLICEVCGSAAEVNDPRLMEALERTADAEGFAPAHPTIEVKGRCPTCQ